MEEECDDRHNSLRNQCSVRNYSGNPVWNVVQYSYMPQKPKRNERSGFEMAKKGFIAEFKEFFARGNVMDLAVGVIIGGAFQSIVNSLVNDMIMPVISLLTKAPRKRLVDDAFASYDTKVIVSVKEDLGE